MDNIDPKAIERAYELVTGRPLAEAVELALKRRQDLVDWTSEESYHMRAEFGVATYADMMRRWYNDEEMDRWNGRYGLDADDWVIGYVPEPGMAKATPVMEARKFDRRMRWFLRRDFAGHVRRQVAAFAAGIKAAPDTVPVAVSTAIVKARQYVATLDITADERDEFGDMADAARTMADVERIREMVRRWRTEVAA